MPRKIFIPTHAVNRHSGIDITWTPSAQRLDLGGWYDSFVGIQGESMTLREFFDKLGISEGDCKRAWRVK